MYEREYDPVECPVADCDHEDDVRSVAAHVARTDDPDHAWDRLGYEGAREFVMAQKSDQREESEAVQRTDPEAVQRFDLEVGRDALVLLDIVKSYDFDSLSDLDVFQLTNLYTLCSHLQSSADTSRQEVRDVLLEAIHDDREVESDLGTIQRRTYERREVRDDQTVERVLREEGIDPDSVRSYDTEKLDEAVEENDIDRDAIFEVEERQQIRRAGVNDDQRYDRFEKLDAELRSLVGERE